MERLYDRQQNPTPNNEYDILVLGTGGIGSWTAINLAMSGMCRSLWLMDGDEVEQSNLNRLPWTEDAIGRKKTTVLQEWINERRDIPVADIDQFLTEDNVEDMQEIESTLDSVLFCADGSDARELATHAFAEMYAQDRLLFFGAEGDEISIYTTHESWSFNEEAGYDDIWAGNAMQAGVAAVNILRSRMNYEESPHGDNPITPSVPPDRFTYTIDPLDRYEAESEADRVQNLRDEVESLSERLEDKQEELDQTEQKLQQVQQSHQQAREVIAGLLQEMRDLIAEDRNIEEESYNDVLERSR